MVGDGLCDDKLNILECQYDGGDCCQLNETLVLLSRCTDCLCKQQRSFETATPATTTTITTLTTTITTATATGSKTTAISSVATASTPTTITGISSLKTSLPATSSMTTTTGMNANCYEIHTNIPTGNVVRPSPEYKTDTAEECQEECQRHAACQFFSWHTLENCKLMSCFYKKDRPKSIPQSVSRCTLWVVLFLFTALSRNCWRINKSCI